MRSTLGCRSEPSGTTCTSRGRRAARTSSETAGARTASSQPSRASGRSTQARLGAPRLSAKTASASRTQKSVHSSPGAAASPTRTTRSFSDSARSSSEVISAEDVRPGSGASLATLPCRRSAVASSSAASATGAPSSSGRAAIVREGWCAVAGVRLAASCAPIARVRPRAKPGASLNQPLELVAAQLQQLAVAPGPDRSRAHLVRQQSQLPENLAAPQHPDQGLGRSLGHDLQPARTDQEEALRDVALAHEPFTGPHPDLVHLGGEPAQQLVVEIRQYRYPSQERRCATRGHSASSPNEVRPSRSGQLLAVLATKAGSEDIPKSGLPQD